MTRMEALKVMIDGGKVREPQWSEGEYLYMDERHVIRDSSGMMYGYYRFTNDLYPVLGDVWELYNE